MAPQVGLEPTTPRLTAECSAVELLRIVNLASLFIITNYFLIVNIIFIKVRVKFLVKIAILNATLF